VIIMSATGTVSVTLDVPRDVYERAAQKAAREHRPLDEVLNSALGAGLVPSETPQQILERVSRSYRARLAREGKLHQTPDEIHAELAKIRQEVADELYPDL
jgi:hypothetical protein